MASQTPARIDLTIEGEQFAPGATVSFNVTVTAQDRLNRSDLVAGLVAVEEVDPYPTGDEDYDDEDEFEDEDEDTGTEGNLVSVSFNGGADEAEGDEDTEDEEEWVESTTYSEELVLAEGLALKAGETRSFSGSFVIPEDAQPSYDGVNATHSWWIDIYLEGDIEINETKEFQVR